MKDQRFLTKQKLSIAGMCLAVFFSFGLIEKTRSANMSSVSVTLATPRLSFVGKLTTGNSVGDTTVNIVTTAGGASSTTSAELAEGDSVLIGDTSTANTYTVASASANPGSFLIRTPSFASLQTNDTDSGDAVIATQSGNMTVRFTTASAISNGAFQILVPATTLSGSAGRANGIPDQDGFDFGTSTPTVTCPSDVGSSYDFVTGTASSSAVTLANVTYHAYSCRYSGSGVASTAFDGTTQGTIVISNVINPSPKIGHVQGYSDPYKILVRNLDSTDTATDSTIVTVGNVESVRVTASVPSQITFGVLAVASGTTTCGQTTDATTTTTTVPFGTVSSSSFKRASQKLNVSTNAANGFTVTISANDQMGKDGGSCAGDPPSGNSCVPDANVSGMSHTTSQDWTSTSNQGLGYSLQDPSSTTTEAFSYNESGRTFSAKQLPDSENSQSAQTIFSATAPATDNNVYVCYQVIVGSSTTAGSYQNTVTYRATASF
ncbi:MAG: hypothetical protein ABI425_03540 [Patescibacteria group bacterium]